MDLLSGADVVGIHAFAALAEALEPDFARVKLTIPPTPRGHALPASDPIDLEQN
jgi:hypothetical protein